MPVPTQDDSLNSDVEDTIFGVYPDVTSSIHPEKEDDAVVNENGNTQQSEDHCTTRSDVLNGKETDIQCSGI